MRLSSAYICVSLTLISDGPRRAVAYKNIFYILYVTILIYDLLTISEAAKEGPN